MRVERREQVTCIGIVRVNGKPEELDGPDGRQQPSMGGTSRMSREAQVRICERLGVKFPGPTRPGVGLRPPGLWGRGSANPANEAVTAIGADGGHPPAKPAIGVTTDFGSELATPVASREAHPDADVITGAAPADVVHRVWQRHDVQPHRVERLLPAWGQFHVINQCGTKGHGRGGRSRRSNGRGKLKTEQESRAGGSIGRDRAKRPLSRAGILFVVLLVVGTAPPAKTRPAATVPPAGVVKIGVSNSQSGPVADFGTSLLAGAM